MRTAIISDIHGNLEALQTVLADIDRRGVDEIICLGDILGYGPNPNECVDLVAERCAWSLLGNHDYAVIYEPTNFNAAAEQGCEGVSLEVAASNQAAIGLYGSLGFVSCGQRSGYYRNGEDALLKWLDLKQIQARTVNRPE